MTRKGRPFFTDYQTHFLRRYHVLLVAAAYNFKRTMKALCCMHQKICEIQCLNNISQKGLFKGRQGHFLINGFVIYNFRVW